MVGATVMGPTKRMMKPTSPRAPITTSTAEAAIKLPAICNVLTVSLLSTKRKKKNIRRDGEGEGGGGGRRQRWRGRR